ncbi:MAG TPA: MMPL family transporter [Dehalococcoidia bacterium]|nr:MMPL family transporter [Dehalococcoidia bacterium]
MSVASSSASSAATASPGALARWARFAVRHRKAVVIAWGLALVLLIGMVIPFGGSFASDFSLPGTESQKALDLLKSRFPTQAGDSARIVFQAKSGINDPEIKARIDGVLLQAKGLSGVVGVQSPFDPNSQAISRDGTVAFATLQYAKQADALPTSDVDQLLKLVDRSKGNGLTVEAGGQVVEATETEPPGSTEAIGLLGAVFILLIAFGSVVAMGLPLATALVGIGSAFALVAFSAHFLSFPTFVTAFASMIGLGVGIDYALFIVTRFREGLHAGRSVEDAVVLAMGTAGRAVSFAGIVVAIALLGLIAVGIPFIAAVGIGASIVVAMAVVVALTLLPALLAFAGTRVDRWQLPLFKTRGAGDARGFWFRFAGGIQRRPWLWLVVSLSALVVLALPFFRIHLGFSDAGNSPTSLHSRRAYDLLTEGFGKGFNGPFMAVVDLKGAGQNGQAALGNVEQALKAAPNVAQVSPPIPNAAGDAAIMTITPQTAPQDSATERMVRDLRKSTLPPAVDGSGARVYVAGPTAAFVDIGDRIESRMPLFFGAVIGLSCLLLIAVFRSVLVALKAAVMNLLSIGASYGVVVAIFQWGWFSNIVGVKAGPIETFLPMMMFAVLFGLSMDYEVFLISRIREEYTQTHNNADSVGHGLAVTARLITAAAAIMVVVFLTFVLGDNRIIKEFGIGLATAIFVDATIVRLVLVPSTMELLGDANWWLPRWLDALLPHLDIEGSRVRAAASESASAIAAAD